jgi:hypothetical protein
MIKPYLYFIVTTLIGSVMTGCALMKTPTPAPSYAPYSERHPCSSWRIGRCFDATIGGEPVAVIADEERQKRIQIKAKNAANRATGIYWEVIEPVDGHRALEVSVSSNEFGRALVGEPDGNIELVIVPLDNQQVKSKAETVASSNVFVNGQAAMRQQNTLTQDSLPPGGYIMFITYPGAQHWDRKTVYFRVK